MLFLLLISTLVLQSKSALYRAAAIRPLSKGLYQELLALAPGRKVIIFSQIISEFPLTLLYSTQEGKENGMIMSNTTSAS